MITDFYPNPGNFYLKHPVWDKAIKFLSTLNSDSEEKKYIIDGDKMFAEVQSYETKSFDMAVLEAHRKHIDIQALLSGTEIINWFPVTGLKTQTDYDESRDVEFFVPQPDAPGNIVLTPGRFAILFPTDAHMPQLSAGSSSERVKKVVIKIKTDLFEK